MRRITDRPTIVDFDSSPHSQLDTPDEIIMSLLSSPPVARRSENCSADCRRLTAPQLGAIVVREVASPRGPRAGASRRSHHGKRLAGRRRASPGAASGALGAGCRRRSRPDGEQGLRLGPEGRDAGRSAIRAGDARCIVAGGMESMSRAPHLLMGSRSGWKYGDEKARRCDDPRRAVVRVRECGDGGRRRLHRRDARRESRRSRCVVGSKAIVGRSRRAKPASFDDEIVPVAVVGGKTTTIVDADEGPRADTSLEQARGAEAGVSDPTGTRHGRQRLADLRRCRGRRRSSSEATLEVARDAVVVPHRRLGRRAACAPKEIFIAPVEAVRQVPGEGEADASPTSICSKSTKRSPRKRWPVPANLKIDEAKLNVNGGAIALGPPDRRERRTRAGHADATPWSIAA